VSVPEGETLSQVTPPFCVETLMLKRVRLDAVTARVRGAGGGAPEAALNDSEAGLTVSAEPPSVCAHPRTANDVESQTALAIRIVSVGD